VVTNLVDELAQHVVALGECDGFLVLVADPVTGDVDAYGPFSGQAAALDADRRRDELDIEGLHEVAVRLVRFHHLPSKAVSPITPSSGALADDATPRRWVRTLPIADS
jgi:hypothetical protein